MFQKSFKYTLIAVLFLACFSCQAQEKTQNTGITIDEEVVNPTDKVLLNNDETGCKIVLGAEQTDAYLPLLKGQKVGIVTNQTGIIPNTDGNIHLVDKLLAEGIHVVRIFAPEHGFRGKADAGELVKDGKDTKTGLPIISLYGKNKKPYDSQVKDLNVLLFDIQDVGVRFYTYISTLHYVMEAAAENNVEVVVLDRPNPNAHYIDGPVLEPNQKTFVGMHPVPIVYGMTIGEYGKMINGENWLKNGVKCDLTVVPLLNYTHEMHYDLPVKPSPNLPNAKSINLYPSLCFFEGTNVSIGRGTETQFQVIGTPFFNLYRFGPKGFTPKPNEGAKHPKHEGKECHGYDLTKSENLNQLELKWLIEFYKANKQYAKDEPFFTKNSGAYWLDKLAGTSALRHQIEKGWTQEQIKATWQDGIEEFKKVREKYLLYK